MMKTSQLHLKTSKPSTLQRLFPWILALAALLFLLIYLEPGPVTGGGQSPMQKNSEVPEFRRRVNEYLQQVDRHLTEERLQMQIDNAKLAPEIKDDLAPADFALHGLAPGVDLTQETRSQETLRDVRKPSKGPDYRKDIDDSVNAQIVVEHSNDEYERAYQQEYLKQFVENAARDGVKIAIDNNMNVRILGVRAPSDDSRTPQSVQDTNMAPKLLSPAGSAAH
jgi:hypothetical protein